LRWVFYRVAVKKGASEPEHEVPGHDKEQHSRGTRKILVVVTEQSSAPLIFFAIPNTELYAGRRFLLEIVFPLLFLILLILDSSCPLLLALDLVLRFLDFFIH
jgi:hypothetical protein